MPAPIPVPKNRFDQAYYQPLKSLSLHAETELCLGLIHHTDGVEGAKKRIEAAKTIIENFGVAVECGFGRRLPEAILELMQIHVAVANPVR